MSRLTWCLQSVPQVGLGKFWMRAQTAKGELALRPMRGITEDHLVDLEFRPSLAEGMDFKTAFESYKTLPEGSDEKRRIGAHLGYQTVDLGRVAELDLMLDLLNRHWDAAPWEPCSPLEQRAMIEAHGFKWAHEIASPNTMKGPTQVYRRLWNKGKGTHSLFVTAHSLCLIFEKRRATSWHNLAYFKSHEEMASGQLEPILWPEGWGFDRVALPLTLAVADGWDPTQVFRRS